MPEDQPRELERAAHVFGPLVRKADPPARSSLVYLPLRLFRRLTRARQYQFLGLLGLTVLGSLAEMISIGTVVPFLAVLTQPEIAFASPQLAPIVRWLGITAPKDMVVPLAMLFAGAAIVAAAVRLVLIRIAVRLNSSTAADLSVEVYRRTLYQPYQVHVARNSSELISGITQKVGIATEVLGALVNVATSGMMFGAILLTLILIDPWMATIALIGFGASYGVIAWAARKRLRRNSQRWAREQTSVVKAMQEGLGAIRDVLLDGTQRVYLEVYERSVRSLRRAMADNAFLGQAPRYAIEALGMVLVAAMAVAVSGRPGGVRSALPVLGALALGAQRLMPLMQQLYNNWAMIAGGEASARDILELLDQPMPKGVDGAEPAPLRFTHSVRFDDVWFRYADGTPWVFEGIDLLIPKSGRVGFVGTTGAGKSTAIDLLMFLLQPTRGRILVDGRELTGDARRAWQRSIAHVPQSIFLADSSVAENIAFGIPPDRIDMDGVRKAASDAQIADFIESRPEGYAAKVGERGISMSGGQRQRIGIARALYRKASVLVLDEATSALDDATERAVMDSIRNLTDDLTVIIVAHRISTLQHCDTIVQLENGRVVQETSYAHFVNSAPGLRVLAKTEA